MTPPPLPDFPLLTTISTGPPPVDLLHPPRDPRTGTAITYPISEPDGPDHLRQRNKLFRLEWSLINLPYAVQIHEENLLAKREIQFSALHAARQAAEWQERVERVLKWRHHADPWVAWDVPHLLPKEIFYRAPVPASVATLTGIPNTADNDGGVCMEHLLREDKKRPGKAVPVFARDWWLWDGGLLEVLDPVAGKERSERFEEMTVAKAVAVESKKGKKREGGWMDKCLRCKVRDAPCSFERARGRGKKMCEGCRRNGCEFCVRIVWGARQEEEEDGEVELKRTYVKVCKTRGLRKLEFMVCVWYEEEEVVDIEALKAYVDELMDGEGVRVWGELFDDRNKANVVLPDWKAVFCEELSMKMGLDRSIIEKWTRAEGVDAQGLTWQDYFHLLKEKWKVRHPGWPREPCSLLYVSELGL